MMKKLLFFVFLSFFAFSVFAQKGAVSGPITKDLINYLNERTDKDMIRVNIRLNEQYDVKALNSKVINFTLEQRRAYVVNELKNFSQTAQHDLLNYLENKSYNQQAEIIHRFWIANMVTCKVSESVIYELAERSDVVRIDIDEERNLLIDEPTPEGIPVDPLADIDEITYNVLKVNAPDVWAEGYTGQGVVVAVIDTGVNYNHDDLEDHMWEDPDYPNHGWDFANDDDNPMDDHGHGTHCSGTVAGDGTAGSQTGVAPDAAIMALKVLDGGGSGSESGVWEGIEFAVEHGANVISMSLGWLHSWSPDRPAWRTTYNNALAAGVVASVAAGNEGGSESSPDDVRTPGDCPPPWLNPDQTLEGGLSAVVCIGATDANDNIAYFSSIGPSSWEDVDPFNDYPFNPEMGLLRPDVSAPGVDVKSCDAFNESGYTTMSGTSMATPCVAGVMALLLSKNINAEPAEISETLETTALDLGADGKDNVFGAGRVDALEAINNLNPPGPVYSNHEINDDSGNGNGEVESGESILLTIEMYNGSDQSFTNIDVTISSESPYVTITDDNEYYGDFASDEYISVEDGFAFDVAEGTPGGKAITFSVASTDGTDTWTSHFSITTYGPDLAFGNLMVDDAAEGNGNGRLDPGETVDLIMEVDNSGQADINDVEVTLAVISDYVTLLNSQQTIPLISSEGTEMAVFTIEIAEDAPVGSVAEFDFEAQSGVFSASTSANLMIGLIVEDWESNSFDQFNWTFSGNADWEISIVNPYEGDYCSQSGDIDDDQTSSMILNYTSAVNDSISFYKAVSSESSYDYLYFIIDDNTVGQWSGEIAWSREVYPVPAGAHTFKWMYSKDGSVSDGDDMGRVDFIVLPPALFPTVDAGADTSICAGETFTTVATAEDYNSLEWTTSGDGTFDDPTVLNSVYTPGTEDIANGEAVLTLTAYGDNGSTSNSMLLQILQEPGVPDMPDGNTELCEGVAESVYTTNGMEGYTYTWEISPSEAGTTESDSAAAIIAWNADFTGGVEISVKAVNMCGESDFSDPVMVSIFENPVVDLGEDAEVCISSSITLDAGNEGAAYLWSTGETTQTIEVDTTGMDENNNRNISVVVTNENNCPAEDEIVIHFIDCSGIDENTSLSGVTIFPNPNNGRFTIQMDVQEEQEMTMEVLSITGKIVYSEKVHVDKGRFSKTWNLQPLNNQMYYLRMSSERGTVIKKLIIK
jgi:subtilisin family serine protease